MIEASIDFGSVFASVGPATIRLLFSGYENVSKLMRIGECLDDDV